MKLLLSLLLFANGYVYSQSVSNLSRKEMLNDFDSLTKTILEVSPQYPVRKIIFGLDLKKEFQNLRNEITDSTTIYDFVMLVQQALTICNDGHTSMIRPNYFPNKSDYTNLGISEQAFRLIKTYDSIWRTPFISKKLNLPIKYINGDYYTIESFNYKNFHISEGLKLIKCKGQNIHNYVQSIYNFKRYMKWDFERKRFYIDDFYNSFNLNSSDTLLLTFEDDKQKKIQINFKLSDSVEIKNHIQVMADSKKVEYWPEEKLLYIRVPEMNDEHFYPRLIHLLADNKKLKKIVIDIRDNNGGGDGVWISILSAIIKYPIIYENQILCNNSTTLRRIFSDRLVNWRPYKIPFLDKQQFAIYDSETSEIKPDSNSLKFNGPIYVLKNDNVYSSAGAFLAVANLSKQLISIGENTGELLGKGISPLLFELFNSKIIYRIEPVIDISNVKQPRDLYHDSVEIPVKLNIKQYLEMVKNKNQLYSKEYLIKKDPLFKKLLSL